MSKKIDNLQTLAMRNIIRNNPKILSSIPSPLTQRARENLAEIIQNKVRTKQSNKRGFYGSPSRMTKAAMIRYIINHKFPNKNIHNSRDIRHNIGTGRLGQPVQRIYGFESPQSSSPKSRSNQQKKLLKQKLENYPKPAVAAIYNTTFRNKIKEQNHKYLGGRTRRKYK